MNFFRLAAKPKRQPNYNSASDLTSDQFLLQVEDLDDILAQNKRGILDWSNIKDEQSMRDEIKRVIPSLSLLFEQAKSKYEARIEDSPREDVKATNARSRDNIPLWEDLLFKSGEYDWQNDPAFIYIVAVSITGLGLEPNGSALDSLYKELQAKGIMGRKKIAKLYHSIAAAERAGVEQDEAKGIVGSTGWLEIPGGETKVTPNVHPEDVRNIDSKYESFDERDYLLQALVVGSGWCLNLDSFRKDYLRGGKFLLYLERGTAKLCMNMIGDKVGEIKGVNNQEINSYLYADELLDLHKTHPDLGLERTDAPSWHGGTSLSAAKEGKEKVIEFNGKDVDEVTEIINRESQGRNPKANPFYYLTESYIQRALHNEGFREACKNILTSSLNSMNFSLHIGRFGLLKKDPDIFERAKAVTKEHFPSFFSGSDAGWGVVDVPTLNISFKALISKEPDIAQLGLETAKRLLNSGMLDDRTVDKLIDLDKYLDGAVKKNPDMSSMAEEMAVDALTNGDFDRFAKFQKIFDIKDVDSGLKESSYPKAREKAIKLLVTDKDAFDRLDEFYDKRLTKEYDVILQEALPHAKTIAGRHLNAFDIDSFQEINERFKYLIGQDADIFKIGRAKAVDSLEQGADDRFDNLDKAFNGAFAAEKETLIEEIYVRVRPQIQKALIEQDKEALMAFNKRFNGRPLKEVRALLTETLGAESPIEMAINRAGFLLDWSVVSSKVDEEDWLAPVVQLNKMFGGAVAKNKGVRDVATNLGRNILIFVDIDSETYDLKPSNPYWDSVYNALIGLFGKDIISESIRAVGADYNNAIRVAAIESIQRGDVEKFHQLSEARPELLNDSQIINRIANDVISALRNGRGPEPESAKLMFQHWDNVLNGQLSAHFNVDAELAKRVNRVDTSQWYQNPPENS